MAISVSHKKAYQYGVIALTILTVILEVIAFGSTGWMRYEGTSRVTDGQDTGSLARNRRFLHQDATKGQEGRDREGGKDVTSRSGETGGSGKPGDLGELARKDEIGSHDEAGGSGSQGGQGERGVSNGLVGGKGGQDKLDTLDDSNTQRRKDDTDKSGSNAENRVGSSSRPFIPPSENAKGRDQLSNEKPDQDAGPSARTPKEESTSKPKPSKNLSNDGVVQRTKQPGSVRTKKPLTGSATRPTRPPGLRHTKQPFTGSATRPTRMPGSNRTKHMLRSDVTPPTRPPGSIHTKKPLPSNATRPTRPPGLRHTKKPFTGSATRPTRMPGSIRTKSPLPSNATRPTRLPGSRRTKNPRKNTNQGNNTTLKTRRNNGRRITTTTGLSMQEKGKTQAQSAEKGQWVSVEIGLWTSVVCQKGVQGDRTLCIRTDGDFTSQGSSIKSMTEVRIEAVFAIIFGFLGSAAILLLMTSSCLPNKKRSLLVVGICGLVISGVLFMISIARAMTINSMTLEEASRDYNGVNINPPWCLIIGGLGAGLAFVISGILATSKWVESRQKWTEFSNEIVFFNESFHNPTQESSG